MSPAVIKTDKFDICILTRNEHRPPHVHIYYQNALSWKFLIDNWNVIKSYLPKKIEKVVVQIIKGNEDFLMKSWYTIVDQKREFLNPITI